MDESTFEVLYRAMFPRLVAYAMTRFDTTTAQDIAAATLETLWYKRVPAPRADALGADQPVEWLDGLAAIDQEVLTLDAAGFSLKEIAVIMDCSEETAKKRLYRARRRARGAIESGRDLR